MTTIETTSKAVAHRMTETIIGSVEILGSSLTPIWFNQMMDVLIDDIFNIKFENAKARFFFTQSVISQINRDAYKLVFPTYAMDSNGNYTKDKSKWA